MTHTDFRARCWELHTELCKNKSCYLISSQIIEANIAFWTMMANYWELLNFQKDAESAIATLEAVEKQIDDIRPPLSMHINDAEDKKEPQSEATYEDRSSQER